MVRETSKSRFYQHKIVEISFDQNKLNNFSTERSIGHILAENEVSDRIQELREELLEEIYKIINGDSLTHHQKKILLMRLSGKTQNEIAKHLQITQSAVHKAISGNIDYKNSKKRYGGVLKKLKKLLSKNEKVQSILKEIKTYKNIQIDETLEFLL